ncbi:winged helix DNA-binding domain-containing protein [Isoptericola sp. NEAU-Y5]|uniref:Winged helix DNA-binding domain-containing protein n=1 Tax=Isoptericola luteus TaxID=2879484 RepID=A0ABS7Z9N7_9MICO|nr:winged helix DNA-binding domain-containing protein [Isoptericola sp. NEAU-Y5]MCA5891775.1 winged helix DNA-binding domain-containing protein [Isoptericola sp. NEAU-Y5]MCA5894608.1 winged helix DNA-binding domain-containing protein [Isoptericola sp. NEAU-Y5]
MTLTFAAVDSARVRAARLDALHLRPDVAGGAQDLTSAVAHLLAVQGQELQPALWGLSRRVAPSPGATSSPGRTEANALLAAGEVLRTHVLRPTWHLLRPDDARWLVRLTGERVARLVASTERSWGMGDLGPGVDAVAAEVADGPRTRAELKEALVARGLLAADAPGVVFTHVLIRAEIGRLVISGPPTEGRPTQHQTYAAFDDRVPSGYGPLGERYDAQEAVLELWRRYLPARAFATVNDLRLWSDITVSALRRGLAVLEDAGEVVRLPGAGDLEGLELVATRETAERWSGAGIPVPSRAGPVVDLLQAYDELLLSYRETRHVVLDPALPLPDRTGSFVHTVLVDGVVAGRWRWPAGRAVDAEHPVEVQWMRDPTPAERAALDEQSAELGAYLAR